MLETLIDLLRPYSFRGKARLISRFVPRSGLRDATVSGFRMRLDLSEHIQRMVYLGAYERWETRQVRRLLGPGMTFVDIGANVGYFSLLAASLVGAQGRVFAVEPSPYAVERLRRTIADNRLESRIRLEAVGLGSEKGSTKLFDADPSNHTPAMFGADDAASSTVPIATLDELIDVWGARQIDLLKIDVEGYEPKVFAGAKRTLAERKIKAILCEFNGLWLKQGGSSSADLYRLLLDAGFRDADEQAATPSEVQLENRLLILSDA